MPASVFGFIIPDSSHGETLFARARKPLCLNGKTGPMWSRFHIHRPLRRFSGALRAFIAVAAGHEGVELLLILGAAQFARILVELRIEIIELAALFV